MAGRMAVTDTRVQTSLVAVLGWGPYRPMPLLGSMACTVDPPGGISLCEGGSVIGVGVFPEISTVILKQLNAGLREVVTKADTGEGQRAAWLNEGRKRLAQAGLGIEVDLDPATYLPIYRRQGSNEAIGADNQVSTAGFGTGAPGAANSWAKWALLALGVAVVGGAAWYAQRTGKKGK